MIKIDIGKNIKKYVSFGGADAAKIETTPYRDWKIVAVGFFVFLVASLAFHTYMSVQINNDNFFTATPVKKEGLIFNKTGLKAVLTVLSAKEQILSGVATTTTSAVDPSR